MEKRLIPYSVHLPEEIYKQLKAAAGERKASALVRDAITLIIEGDDTFNGGYNKAVRDLDAMIADDDILNQVGFNGRTMAEHVQSILSDMYVPQHIKGNNRGKKEK